MKTENIYQLYPLFIIAIFTAIAVLLYEPKPKEIPPPKPVMVDSIVFHCVKCGQINIHYIYDSTLFIKK